MKTIKIHQYGKTFAKNNIDVENEVIKKLKIFNWYFKYNNTVTSEQYEKLNNVKNQIKNQFDCNERFLTFNINL